MAFIATVLIIVGVVLFIVVVVVVFLTIRVKLRERRHHQLIGSQCALANCALRRVIFGSSHAVALCRCADNRRVTPIHPSLRPILAPFLDCCFVPSNPCRLLFCRSIACHSWSTRAITVCRGCRVVRRGQESMPHHKLLEDGLLHGGELLFLRPNFLLATMLSANQADQLDLLAPRQRRFLANRALRHLLHLPVDGRQRDGLRARLARLAAVLLHSEGEVEQVGDLPLPRLHLLCRRHHLLRRRRLPLA
mmetsp:Transcript_32908/g.79969  ORF Transcript_32908/g.79969 Transcript_32908/m.79969 type:complete len:249 (-) Transcript_32908:632-1378(-)